jgi:hypothetical protein
MQRKEFLKTFFKTGLGVSCCAAAIGQSLLTGLAQAAGNDQDWINKYQKQMAESSKSPAWNRAEKSEAWIKNIISNMDTILDRETAVKLLQANGRSCYNDAFGVASDEPPSPEQAAAWMKYLQDKGCEIKREGNITTVIYSWGKDHQNPYGMILGEGNCLCPVVEKITSGLSPTYCQCSAGYVGEIFRRYLGKPVKSDIIDSLKMGGKDCLFRLEITEV